MASHKGERFTSHSRLLGLSVVCLAALNILALATKPYGLLQVTASATLGCGVYSMWRFLRLGEENVPFFPLIALLYGMYYSFFQLTPFEPNVSYLGVAQGSLLRASALSLAGLAVLVAGYYGWLIPVPLATLPQLSLYWSTDKAKRAAVVFGVVGMAGQVTRLTYQITIQLDAIVYFVAQLSLLSIGILFFLSLERQLSTAYRGLLWLALVPLQIVTDLSTGSAFPLIRLAAFLLMIYVSVKRVIPWRQGLVVLLLVSPVLAFKSEYRKLAWVEGKVAAAGSFSELFRRGVAFPVTIASVVQQTGAAGLYYGGEIIAQRLDLSYVFGYILELTPKDVPYWDGATYSDVLWKFMPRVFFPDKPRVGWGNEFGQRYGLLDPSNDATSINLPQMIEMHINFGALGLVVGMWLLSQIYRLLTHLLNHRDVGQWGTVCGALVLSSLFNIESNLLLVFGAVIQTALLLYLLGLLVRRDDEVTDGKKVTPRLGGLGAEPVKDVLRPVHVQREPWHR